MSIAIQEPATEAEERAVRVARLAEWIRARQVTGNYSTFQIAARVVAQSNPAWLDAALDQGGTPYLADMCARIKDDADLTDAEFVREEIRHGHLARRLEVAR